MNDELWIKSQYFKLIVLKNKTDIFRKRKIGETPDIDRLELLITFPIGVSGGCDEGNWVNVRWKRARLDSRISVRWCRVTLYNPSTSLHWISPLSSVSTHLYIRTCVEQIMDKSWDVRVPFSELGLRREVTETEEATYCPWLAIRPTWIKYSSPHAENIYILILINSFYFKKFYFFNILLYCKKY